jgi:hypothetical protein|tara:strand:+ start:21104 stop:21754 length:651 start_codon:yes stop_codon:yes gene_type:complete
LIKLKQFTFGANKKVNFVRIPKNASTSLYNYFGATNTIRDNYLNVDNQVYKNIFAPSHCRLDFAVKEFGERILDLPTLAVIRNPYDRMVSMYFFAQKFKLNKIYDVNIDNFLKFCEDFESLCSDEDFFHGWTQKSFIELEGNISVGNLIRFENLEVEFTKFLHEHNLKNFYKKAGIQLKKENQTKHKAYQEYFCPKSKNIINKIWGEDVDYFGYLF